jgi:hypothetical protein
MPTSATMAATATATATSSALGVSVQGKSHTGDENR